MLYGVATLNNLFGTCTANLECGEEHRIIETTDYPALTLFLTKGTKVRDEFIGMQVLHKLIITRTTQSEKNRKIPIHKARFLRTAKHTIMIMFDEHNSTHGKFSI